MNMLVSPPFEQSVRADVPNRKRPLGQILVEMGALSPDDMIMAGALSQREDALFGEILLANDMASETAIYAGLAEQFGCQFANLAQTPPDFRLIDQLGPEVCIREGIIPWMRISSAVVFVTSRPERFQDFAKRHFEDFPLALMAVAPEKDIQAALFRYRQHVLTHRAETRVALDDSCRVWQSGTMGHMATAFAISLITLIFVAPQATFVAMCGWAVFTLWLNTALKIAAAISTLRDSRKTQPVFRSQREKGPMRRLPTVSILVPLYKETAIATKLVRRLSLLSYPKELLDICLIVEQDDATTQNTIAAADLPRWMRQIVVPRGAVKTKPRALNYALDFCRGSIIGVYDAEDAPEPDQIHKIVRRFHECDPQTACLQGVLDFYNPRQNWLSRCFTIEYATWFRVILPGLQNLGLAIPLGGTTLFFRRNILEELGGWDAHNVTEDADLGIRLARRGYKTELVATATLEEANCRPWSWVKQRSRWLKGYAMTWAVHMRAPRRLWRDLGAWRFFGFQLLFLGTLSQYLLAPLLWSFWALPLGLPHPLTNIFNGQQFIALTVLFMSAEIVSLSVATYAVSSNHHRRLWPWVPTLHLYFPLGALAAYKAFWEMMTKPFYWDKTSHGLQTKQTSRLIRFFRRPT